jgi:hypothetical protein
MPKAQNQKYFDRIHRCLSVAYPSALLARTWFLLFARFHAN